MDRAPVIILGAPRSGTTLLGRIFEAHPDVAYWPEPRLVWSTGNHNLPDDSLDAIHLTPRNARKIDRQFSAFLEKSGRLQFVEKTPSNLLRLPFVAELYPAAKFILIEREPLAAIYSMAKLEKMPPDADRIVSRLRHLRPSHLPDLFRRVFDKDERAFFGPRVPGWRDLVDLPTPVRLARQYRQMMAIAQPQLETIQPYRINFETLLERPESTVSSMLEFAELRPIDHTSYPTINPTRESHWREEIDPVFAAQALEELGNDTLSGAIV